MKTVLIVYASKYGHTAKIAAQLCAHLQAVGLQAESIDLKQGVAAQRLIDCDGLLLGSSVIAGKHSKALSRFIRHHRDLLTKKTSGFFSVSLASASTKPEGQTAAIVLRKSFLQQVGWMPECQTGFAGALVYSRYNFLIRWLMRSISAKEGGATDTSRDYVYTDWQAVKDFAAEFAALLKR